MNSIQLIQQHSALASAPPVYWLHLVAHFNATWYEYDSHEIVLKEGSNAPIEVKVRFRMTTSPGVWGHHPVSKAISLGNVNPFSGGNEEFRCQFYFNPGEPPSVSLLRTGSVTSQNEPTEVARPR